jgi:hypothetical protein
MGFFCAKFIKQEGVSAQREWLARSSSRLSEPLADGPNTVERHSGCSFLASFTTPLQSLPCSVADAHAATHGALVAAVSSATSTAAVRDAEVAAHGAFGAAEHLAPAAATVSDAQAALECRLGAVERAAALAAAVRGRLGRLATTSKSARNVE